MRESDFWEIPVAPDVLDSWAHAPEGLEDPADEARRARWDRLRDELVAVLQELVATRLTDRQRRVVQLYFYDGLTQQQIADELGISQQVVSRQLFGVMRNGRKIGGAVKRLRDLCKELGLDPDRWV